MSAKRTLSLAFESRIRLFTGQVLLLRLCRLDEKCNDYQMYPHPRFLPLTAGRRSCSWRLEVFSVKISSRSFHSIPPVSTTFVYGDDGYRAIVTIVMIGTKLFKLKHERHLI